MRFFIRHELPNRMRVHLPMKRMSFAEADTLAYYLESHEKVKEAKVYERTADAVIFFDGDRDGIIEALKAFSFEGTKVPAGYIENSGRSLTAGYYESIVSKVVMHYGRRLLLPLPVRQIITVAQSLKFVKRALDTIPHKRLEVPVLDAIAIVASMLTGDFDTASSVMFLLDIGDTLEEWTHKKSVDDLARRMSLNIEKVWLKSGDDEVLVDAESVKENDRVIVRVGNIIPFDGEVESGEAMVNQASMTGEAIPVKKEAGKSVYAGTVVEEGEIVVLVKKVGGSGRFDKIVAIIEESEKLKSALESRAEHLADRLVPYTLGGAALTYLLTRNVTKAVSVLMVDYSCALKLAMPISVLSAIRESARYDINVKGGKFLEAIAEADTIVFDKTGTLTKAEPTVHDVIAFNDEEPDELLREAACLEEHFPHSIANAVVRAAEERGLLHDEMHSKVEYIVAHGIATTIDGKRAIIGSYHFVFEDEEAMIPGDKKKLFNELPSEYSQLYYAKEGRLAAVILIEDPLRDEAVAVIEALREAGFSHTVMMTGDSERTAKAIADRLGLLEYYSEVLPEDKAGFVEKARANGSRVIMVGDGINDSPALSAADAGIAINDGAEIARQIADVTIGSDDLARLVLLREISEALMKRIRFNYRTIISFNTALIILGVVGILPPATSALLHNASTVALGIKSTTRLV